MGMISQGIAEERKRKAKDSDLLRVDSRSQA